MEKKGEMTSILLYVGICRECIGFGNPNPLSKRPMKVI